MTNVISAELPPGLKNKLDNLAATRKVSMNKLLNMILPQYFILLYEKAGFDKVKVRLENEISRLNVELDAQKTKHKEKMDYLHNQMKQEKEASYHQIKREKEASHQFGYEGGRKIGLAIGFLLGFFVFGVIAVVILAFLYFLPLFDRFF